MSQKNERRLAVIMFSDISENSNMIQLDKNHAKSFRTKHFTIFKEGISSHQGQIIQYYGNGVLSIFNSVVKAVESAIKIQHDLQEEELVGGVKIGMHLGDLVYTKDEVYGDSVNIAARIESMATHGSILISRKLNDELHNQKHISTQLLGKFHLKNIENAVEIFAVSNAGIHVPKSNELSIKNIAPNKSIAVLPFVNMSANPDEEYFCDGITEEIINALTKINGLRVTSRTSSFYFKGKNIPIPKIGAELNVSTILEGSIRLVGKKMRLTAQLINVSDDYHFFSENFDRTIEDIFEVQDELSLLIADQLREHMGHFEIDEKLVDSKDISIDAYKKYLHARFHILKMSKRDIDLGISILNEIIETQSEFPYAYLGLHLAYTLLGTIGLMPANEAFMHAQKHLDSAIRLNPMLPECQLQLSYAAFLQKWDFQLAYKHLNQSRAIRPTVEFYQSMASVLVAEAKFDAALYYIETAIQLDPLSNINFHLSGFISYCKEDYETALKFFKKSIELNPGFTASQLYLGQTLLLIGQEEKALQYFQNMPDNTKDLIKLGGTTLAHSSLGNLDKANEGIAELERAMNTELVERGLNFLILCQLSLGRHEKALSLLDKAINIRLPMVVYSFVDPLLKAIRTNDQFIALKKTVFGTKIEEQTENRKYKQQLFSQEELVTYKKDLMLLMDEEQAYLDSKLSLRSLAEKINLHPNKLSQLLNEGFDKNFSDFVNEYRIEAFKSKVKNPQNDHLTIMALALDIGFNSKTTFNASFKKLTGITPSKYWKDTKLN